MEDWLESKQWQHYGPGAWAVDHMSLIAFHHIPWLQQCRARLSCQAAQLLQEEGKEAVREGIGCHISPGPCNSICASARRLLYFRDLVALGVLPSWGLQVCLYIFLPVHFSEGVWWQETLINLCGFFFFSLQYLSVIHLLLDSLVHSLSQFFSMKTRIREDTTCEMSNAEIDEEGNISA